MDQINMNMFQNLLEPSDQFLRKIDTQAMASVLQRVRDRIATPGVCGQTRITSTARPRVRATRTAPQFSRDSQLDPLAAAPWRTR
jgi:hypothetical protein